MALIDLKSTPYEFFIDMSNNFEYNNKIFNTKCVCKDVLLKTLDEIKNIENLINYNVYICGKINSSSPFPTWDCDLTLENSNLNKDELLEIFKKIKETGLNNNLVFDLKFIWNIKDWNKGVGTPDQYFNISQVIFFWDSSGNKFVLEENTRSMRIRKRSNRFYTYYKALLIKKKGFLNLEEHGLNFISNSILPDSSLRGLNIYNDGDRTSFRKLEPVDTTNFTEEELAFHNSLK
jgi:hypothetical protein